MSQIIDFLQKSGKGEGERGKGLVFSFSPIKMSPFDRKSAKSNESKKSNARILDFEFWDQSLWFTNNLGLL
jgi:hypothetical protein